MSVGTTAFAYSSGSGAVPFVPYAVESDAIVKYTLSEDNTQIFASTKSGKRGYYKQTLLFAVMAAVLSSLIISVPYFLQILNKYGTQGFSSQLNSITEYADIKLSISVGTAMIMVIAGTVLVTAVCGCIIAIISSRCKSMISAYCINVGVFSLPVALNLLVL